MFRWVSFKAPAADCMQVDLHSASLSTFVILNHTHSLTSILILGNDNMLYVAEKLALSARIGGYTG